MLREHHIGCLFTSAPVSECAREMVLPAQTLASSWPMALILVPIAVLSVYAFIRSLYPAPIDWEDGDDRSEKPEDRARRTPF